MSGSNQSSTAPCEWTVIRVYPDPIAGECINIGVVVIAGDATHSRYLRNWDRVEAFTGERRWISDYAMGCDWDPDGVRWMAENANGEVQCDPIQPSLESDPVALLNRLAKRYLKDGDG